MLKKVISALGKAEDVEGFFEETNDLEDLGLQGVSRSGDEIRSLCPFHSESNPSFYVNRTTGAYFCHSCPANGGLSSLISRLAGSEVAIRNTDSAKKQRKPMSFSDYTDCAERSSIAYPEEYKLAKILYIHDDNLAERRLSAVLCHKYGMFSCRFSHLGRTGDGIVIPIGICKTHSEDIERNLFQIRTISEGFPKYINNFNCSKTIFGLRDAMKIRKVSNPSCIIVTEGVFDAVSISSCVGADAMVVSSFGATMSHEQIGFCLMLSKNIVVAYDNDENNAGDRFYSAFTSNKEKVASILPGRMIRCKPHSKDFGTMCESDLVIVKNLIGEVSSNE